MKLNGMAGLLDPVMVVLVAVLVLVVVLGTVPCMVGGVNCWVEIEPIVLAAPVLKRLIPNVCTVSYTHLDVYKRQGHVSGGG